MINIQNFFRETWEATVREANHIKEETNNFLVKSHARVIQPTLQTIKEYSPLFQERLTTLKQVAIRVAIRIVEIVVSVGLFGWQTTFFLIGAAVSIAFPEEMRASIDRISKVWASLPLVLQVLAFVPFPIAWPSYCLVAAPFVGASVCLYFQDKAGIQRKDPQPSTTEIFTSLLEAIRLNTAELQNIQFLLAANFILNNMRQQNVQLQGPVVTVSPRVTPI